MLINLIVFQGSSKNAFRGQLVLFWPHVMYTVTFLCVFATVQVHGKLAADSYVVFPEHYCSCKAFQFDVVGKNDAAFVSGFSWCLSYLCSSFLLDWRMSADAAVCRSCGSCTPCGKLDPANFHLQCKHQLAARIGQALGKCTSEEVPDITLSNMLMAA